MLNEADVDPQNHDIPSLRVQKGQTKIEEWRDVSFYWNKQPERGKIHVMAVLPEETEPVGGVIVLFYSLIVGHPLDSPTFQPHST